jgi:hypothetical protein
LRRTAGAIVERRRFAPSETCASHKIAPIVAGSRNLIPVSAGTCAAAHLSQV